MAEDELGRLKSEYERLRDKYTDLLFEYALMLDFLKYKKLEREFELFKQGKDKHGRSLL